MSHRRTSRWSVCLLRLVFILPLALLGVLGSPSNMADTPAGAATRSYTNPLPVQVPGDGLVESCPCPTGFMPGIVA